MARVLPGGPALAVSSDNATVAVVDQGRLALVDSQDRSERAESALSVVGVSEVAFVGTTPRLLVTIRTAESTTLLALSTPSLEPIAKLELPTPQRILAFVGERVLLAADDGDGAKVVTLTTKLLVAEPIALRVPVRLAAAAPEDRLLAESKGQLEFWDPVLKRALFRLNLPLPPASRAIGFTGRGRLLWVAGEGETGPFEVFRFSDGRRQLAVELGGEILAVEGSAINNRVVVALRAEAGGPVELVHLDLGLREKQELTLEHPLASFVVVEGERPQIVAAAAGAPLGFVSLAKASGAARPQPLVITVAAPEPRAGEVEAPPADAQVSQPAAPASVEARAPAGGAQAPATAADRFAAWRTRLQGARAAAAAAEIEAEPPRAEPVAAAPAPRLGRRWGMATGSVRSQPAVTEPSASAAPVTARSPQPPRAAAPARPVGQTVRATAAPAARSPRPAPRPEPAADEPLVAHSDAEERTGWRAALIDWGNAALSSPERGIQPPPLDGAAPMIALAERFALEPAAVRALALLYAGWLLGYGDSGLPAAQVARAIGEEDDWRESLGRGELERHGMARSRRGRLRLRRVVGRFLDGGAPGTVATHPPQRAAKPTATPTSLVPLGARETLAAAAVRCAAALGRDVAPINLPEGPPKRLARRLADGLFEARVLGAVPLVPWCAALEPELARLVAAGALIAVPEGELSAALIRLPVLRTSPDAAP